MLTKDSLLFGFAAEKSALPIIGKAELIYFSLNNCAAISRPNII